METVRESKLKLHSTFNDSESIHLKSCIDTGIPFIPTSINDNMETTVVIINNEHVINWDPVTPIFLPKNPEKMEPNKGSVMIVKYIT